jgi:hypothetical protein
MEPHFQESEYFYPGIRTKAAIDLLFFSNTLLLITFHAGDLHRGNAIHHNPTFEIQ